MDTQFVRDHIASCLYGGALGDALGYAIEFDSWKTIQAKYGPCGIQAPELDGGKARVSDDTQMTLFTAEGIGYGFFRAAERGIGADAEHYIYQSYLCWLQTQGYPAESLWSQVSRLKANPDMNHRRAPGNTCLSALRSGKMGTLDEPINNSKGCGGVMRTAPLGFLRCAWNGKNPYGSPLLCGARAAAITHGHPLGWIPAGMLSDMVDRCLYEKYPSLKQLTEDSLAETVRTFADIPEIKPFEALIRRAIALSESPVETAEEPVVRSLGGGWVGEEALAIAIYAVLRHPSNLKNALLAAVNHSGDSDSTGAIAGNILGAYLGMKAIPVDWTDKLELRDEMDEIADMMKRAIEYY